MKKIKKMRLINWHFFEDQTIDFSDINVITGENGTGKSTILDAIHYLQSGGTCKFNMAANTLSHGRTVENYLKARIGIENKEFLRNQSNIIGHIAIEYFDTLFNRKYVLGCVIQLVGSQLSSIDFYDIKGSGWNDDLFFTKDNKVRGFDSLLKEGLNQRLEISRVGQSRQSATQRKKAVREALGVPEKYETLFTKAMSFEPLNDINKFAIEFLLPEEGIDLSSIKGSMDSYRELQNMLEKENHRKELLEPIYLHNEPYEKALKDSDIYSLLLDKYFIQSVDESIKVNSRQIDNINSIIASNDEQIKNYNLDKTNYENEVKRRENDPAYNALNEAEKQKNSCEKEISKKKKEIKIWLDDIEKESLLAAKVGTSLLLTNVIEKKNYPEYLNLLSKYKDRLIEIDKENEKNRTDARVELKQLEERLLLLNEEIKNLEAGSYDYPKFVKGMENLIKTEILNKKGVNNPSVVPFCSYLEIIDENWRYALEGYLDRYRFDFFLNKEFYSIAMQCFKNHPELKNNFGVGVITKLPNNVELNKDSLASKVIAVRTDPNTNQKKELIEPTKYLKYLLNDIACVESVNDFMDGQKAITKEGIYFDGHSIRHVNDEAGNKSYIGQESIKLRLSKAKSKRDELSLQKTKQDRVVAECDSLNAKLKSSCAENLLKKENLWEQEASLLEKKEVLDKTINDLVKNNNDLVSLNNAINQYRRMALEADKKARDLEYKNKNLIEEMGKKKQLIVTSNDDKRKKEKEYNEKFSKFNESNINAEQLLLDASKGMTGLKLKEFALHNLGTASNQIKAYENVISKAMSDYCHYYPNEMKPEMDNYISFVQRYNKIVNDDLAKLRPEVDNAKEKSELELNEHFISKIRHAIENARKDIKALNDVLKRHPFGTDNERFEFYASKKKDKFLSGVYHIAMETNQDTVENNLFTEELDSTSKETMSQVFKVLSTNDDDNEFKCLRRDILDYRSYLNYDIKININNSDDALLYSKNQDSKSGGETQTPFYALIAAAFQSVVSQPERNKQSPCSLVVFDEAFNNMDGERIKQMLEFYKELNIQLIISVPSSRFGYISPYADNIISLAKVGNNVAVFESVKKEA